MSGGTFSNTEASACKEYINLSNEGKLLHSHGKLFTDGHARLRADVGYWKSVVIHKWPGWSENLIDETLREIEMAKLFFRYSVEGEDDEFFIVREKIYSLRWNTNICMVAQCPNPVTGQKEETMTYGAFLKIAREFVVTERWNIPLIVREGLFKDRPAGEEAPPLPALFTHLAETTGGIGMQAVSAEDPKLLRNIGQWAHLVTISCEDMPPGIVIDPQQLRIQMLRYRLAQYSEDKIARLTSGCGYDTRMLVRQLPTYEQLLKLRDDFLEDEQERQHA